MHNLSPYQLKKDPWSSHTIILQWLSEIKPLSRVVEIGTATGILGKLLQNRRSFNLIGIEINQEWAVQAKEFYDELIVGDINNIPNKTFSEADCIVLADILEHLIDPNITFSQIISSLPGGSKILISVPNIANIWIRINLLFGKFNYGDRGILDRTHLHFYTKKSLFILINQNRLVIEKFKCSTLPLNIFHSFFEKNVFGRIFHFVLSRFTIFLPTLFGYQLLVNCRKPHDNEN